MPFAPVKNTPATTMVSKHHSTDNLSYKNTKPLTWQTKPAFEISLREIHWQNSKTHSPSPQELKVDTGTDENGCTEVITDLQIQIPSNPYRDVMKLKWMVEQTFVSCPSESATPCFLKTMTIIAFPRPVPYKLLGKWSWNHITKESYQSMADQLSKWMSST